MHIRSSSIFTLPLVLLSLAGCGGDDSGDASGGGTGQGPGGKEDACAFRTKVSGAAEADVDFAGPGYCGSASGGEAVTLLFGYGSTQNETGLGFTIRAVFAGPTETGPKPVVVEVGQGCNFFGSECDEAWVAPEGACTLDVKMHEATREDDILSYAYLAGEGSCSAPAASEAGSELTIAPFSIEIEHVY